jgi:DNA-binding LacI/PurR family transcriptional regulator
LVERLARRGIPTVLLDQSLPQLCSISTDDIVGARMAVEHLIELGHRKIGYISDIINDGQANPLQFTTPRERYMGYFEALESADIHYNPAYHKQGPHAKRYAYELALELLQQDDPPTAIFAMSDTQAIGALLAAQTLGIQVPEQLSIIGYDDIEVAQYLNLTTIRQPLFESGVEAVNLLLGQIVIESDAAASGSAEIIHHSLPLELVIRETTRKHAK